MAALIDQYFIVWRGTAPTLRFTLNPVISAGIAGWTIKFTARKKASDPDPPVLSISAAIVDAVACIIDVPLTKGQTMGLIVRNYDVSLMRTDSGTEDMLATGIMTVKYDVLDAKA